MSSRNRERLRSTAAWRISIWTTVAFALGTAIAFAIMYFLVGREIQNRSDAWLSGEAETLANVSANTPRDSLYDRIVEEVAELASHEVADRLAERGRHQHQNTVFFMQTVAGQQPLWVGPEPKAKFINAIVSTSLSPGIPASITIPGIRLPFRVVSQPLKDGEHLYLGFADLAAIHMMHRLTNGFLAIWCGMVVLGFLISSLGAYRTLRRVQHITDAVAKIGTEDLSSRLPEGKHPDEITRLASTFNRMLDRIQQSVHQLRILTDSVAHDLKSPVTSIRGTLEVALVENGDRPWQESVAQAIDGLDRLSEMLNTTLDLAEADAGALQLRREYVDFGSVVQQLVELYKPAMADRKHQVSTQIAPSIVVEADVGLLNRAIANLLENELTHVPPGRQISVSVSSNKEDEVSLVIVDDGPGFAPEIRHRAFERFVKGRESSGHGLGLAFVNAVAQAHGGHAEIREAGDKGSMITFTLPLAPVRAL